jgi:hypothetical protein
MVFGNEHKVKSHRLGRRRKKGGARMIVAPWIVITMVSVLVAAGLTWGFVTLLRSGCDGMWRVTVAAAPSMYNTLDDAARAWEATEPEVGGECVGIEVREVPSADASRGITSGTWDDKSFGKRPIAWVPDSQAWASWVASSETTAGYVSGDPVVLGQASSVLAVAESTATALNWLGGEPPTWADVTAAARAGTINLAAANPRTSTEGLVALLNATSDGAGGFSADAMSAYAGALEAGTVTDDVEDQLDAYAESGDATQVFTALDYQMEEHNDTASDDPLVPVTPSGSAVGAVATYLVLGGADWVSESDADIAKRFGDFLQSQVDSGEFDDAELEAVDDPQAALAQTTPAVVGETVRAWQVGREDLHVLFLLDRSSAVAEETVTYDGADLTAGDAAVRTAVATVEGMESTYKAGLWEYGVDPGDGSTARSVTDLAEMSEDSQASLIEDMYDISADDPYEGGSPLYDSLVEAYGYMDGQAADGALSVIVVLTNSGQDDVSQPTVDETAETLEGLGGSVAVYTVGFGEANAENLTKLAVGGAFIEAPAEGGVLDAIGGS